MHLFVVLSRYFGYLALRLYAPGPLPESAFHTSFEGKSTAMSDTYRRVWRVGQFIGWGLVVFLTIVVIGLVVWLI